VQVLVTDSSCKAQVLRSAKSLNVPIVSTEWIIQCLINGQVMDFTGHPRYQYDFAVIWTNKWNDNDIFIRSAW
jgi:hypothetical protein